ncbi:MULTISPECIES: hypothetical protein [unclassified Microbacterium]|uniref:hypothetical protein n=1 Tax=unclassified Microbacterium TaxID=2609290 RepID=UPI003019EE19
MRTRRTDGVRRRKATALGVSLAIAAGLLTPIVVANVAQAATELMVNSVGLEAAAGSKTDGICQSTAGTCTLRAAIEESNALAAAAGEVKIGVDPNFAGGNINITTATANRMRNTNVYAANGAVLGDQRDDTAAVFEVTAPVTIDLEHKITVHTAATTDYAQAVFHLNGPDITIRAIDDVWSGETSFYVGPQAKRVTLDDINADAPYYYPERLLVVRGGAEDITLSNSTMHGFAGAERDYNWVVVDGTSASFPVKGLTVTGNTFVANASGACNGSSTVGCSSSPLDAAGQFITELEFSDNVAPNLNRASSQGARGLDLRAATVGTLKVKDNTFDAAYYRAGTSVISMGGATTIDSFEITGNAFTEMSGNGTDDVGAAIELPTSKRITTGGKISDNVFVATGTFNADAIHWAGADSTDSATNLADSRVSIVDNHFDGFSVANGSRASIRMTQP